jgi:hypothetical protein
MAIFIPVCPSGRGKDKPPHWIEVKHFNFPRMDALEFPRMKVKAGTGVAPLFGHALGAKLRLWLILVLLHNHKQGRNQSPPKKKHPQN